MTLPVTPPPSSEWLNSEPVLWRKATLWASRCGWQSFPLTDYWYRLLSLPCPVLEVGEYGHPEPFLVLTDLPIFEAADLNFLLATMALLTHTGSDPRLFTEPKREETRRLLRRIQTWSESPPAWASGDPLRVVRGPVE